MSKHDMKVDQEQNGPSLVIGGDSTIGRALMKSFKAEGKQVWHTTRHYNRVGERKVFLDLSHDVSRWPFPERIDTTFFCAAITSIERCQLEPKATRKINVDQTVLLARRLIDSGLFIVYLSTDAVFNGKKPYPKVYDPVDPKTEYGKQKAEAEKQLLSFGNQVAVVRLGKVISPDMSLFQGWIRDLKEGKTIHPFSDIVVAPISLNYACSVLLEVAMNKFAGITHASAPVDISYAEAAFFIAKRIGVDRTLVQPIKCKTDVIPFKPRHTTLYCNRLNQNMGLVGIDALTTINGLRDNG